MPQLSFSVKGSHSSRVTPRDDGGERWAHSRLYPRIPCSRQGSHDGVWVLSQWLSPSDLDELAGRPLGFLARPGTEKGLQRSLFLGGLWLRATAPPGSLVPWGGGCWLPTEVDRTGLSWHLALKGPCFLPFPLLLCTQFPTGGPFPYTHPLLSQPTPVSLSH